MAVTLMRYPTLSFKLSEVARTNIKFDEDDTGEVGVLTDPV